MNILIASSEVVPFAKTGGLADVCGALPVSLEKLGHRPYVFLPAYRAVFSSGMEIVETGIEFEIPISSKVVTGRLLKSKLPDSDVDVYLVDQHLYFDRPELYREAAEDYNDNCERFVFFCRAVLESIELLELQIDIIHCNDWQTGLIPALVALEYRERETFESISTLLTIHNLAYQGSFWHWDMLLTGLDWKYFNWHQMEFYERLNLLKTGIVFADSINTVSPRYAEEIQEAELGCGLEGVLRHRREVLSGIINGIDDRIWNPATDPFLAANYDVTSWMEGKKECKRELQTLMGLPVSGSVPVVGLVGRLADQKGWGLVIDVMKSWLPRIDVQWVILGTGEPQYHHALEELSNEFPLKVAAKLTFSNELAHKIEAGADLFLMPSQYEPCGLNQLYSLRYGTVPVVRTTGGLADTIKDAGLNGSFDSQTNGFRFDEFSVEGLESGLRRAIDMYTEQPELWEKLVENGMNQDWSWTKSACHYIELYTSTIFRRKLASLK